MRSIALAALIVGAGVIQEPRPERASLVAVDLGVVRSNAESVHSLTQASFELLIDDQPHPIETFENDQRLVCVALLLDVTRSMYLSSTNYRFGRSWLSPLQFRDRVIVGSIARPFRMGKLSTDRRELQSAVDAAFSRPQEERSGPSPVWDAIDAGLAALEQERDARRAIIAVTDGFSTGNARSFNDVVRRAVASGISVSIVYAPTGADRRPVRQPEGGELRNMAEGGLLKLVDETGGLFRHAGDGPYADPEPQVAKIIRWLHEGYVLGFAPPVRDGKLHKVEVKVKQPGLVVLARKAFLAPAATSDKPD